jgi:hypothetical protein
VVAERQGQTAARNMLGQREVFDAVQFFWSQHYDMPIIYVGHAERWDEAIEGDIADRDCLLRYSARAAYSPSFRSIATSQAFSLSLQWSRHQAYRSTRPFWRVERLPELKQRSGR